MWTYCTKGGEILFEMPMFIWSKKYTSDQSNNLVYFFFMNLILVPMLELKEVFMLTLNLRNGFYLSYCARIIIHKILLILRDLPILNSQMSSFPLALFLNGCLHMSFIHCLIPFPLSLSKLVCPLWYSYWWWILEWVYNVYVKNNNSLRVSL